MFRKVLCIKLDKKYLRVWLYFCVTFCRRIFLPQESQILNVFTLILKV